MKESESILARQLHDTRAELQNIIELIPEALEETLDGLIRRMEEARTDIGLALGEAEEVREGVTGAGHECEHRNTANIDGAGYVTCQDCGRHVPYE